MDVTVNPDLGPLVRRLAPRAMCHSCAGFTQDNATGLGYGVRWMGNENAAMPLPSWSAATDCEIAGNPQASIYCPPSSDTVLRQHYWLVGLPLCLQKNEKQKKETKKKGERKRKKKKKV